MFFSEQLNSLPLHMLKQKKPKTKDTWNRHKSICFIAVSSEFFSAKHIQAVNSNAQEKCLNSALLDQYEHT
jgi:hypothetical protein